MGLEGGGAMRSPGVCLALIIGVLWVLSWIVGLLIAPGVRLGGVSLLTWSHIFVGVVAIVFSLIAIPLLERWESS
jgi:hypothetical protein